MTYKRENTSTNKRYARTIDQFYGLHLGYSKTDAPASFSSGSDLEFSYKKPSLRPGFRKNHLIAYASDIVDLSFLTIGGVRMLGVIQGNTLSVYPVEDVLAGVRKYYTWQELYDRFTWDDVSDKTWDDLFKGDNNP